MGQIFRQTVRRDDTKFELLALRRTNGVPMAEIQSMLGHSSITTTEHYAALLRPTAPTASGNKVFNAAFANIV